MSDKQLILELPGLCGNAEVLVKAEKVFADYPQVQQRLANLAEVARGIESRFGGMQVYYDLSELRGYNYHTGIVFAAYLGKVRSRVAQGGRYDSIGRLFGRDRGATGFDVDVKALARFATTTEVQRPVVVVEPGLGLDDRRRWEKIRELREAGYIVLESGKETEAHDFILNDYDGEWQLTKTYQKDRQSN